MFRHHCAILRELVFITLPSYISTIAAYVTWQGNEDKLPEDGTFGVETCRSLII